MEDELKSKDAGEGGTAKRGLFSRRELLISLGKWSKIVVGVAAGGAALFSGGKESYGGAWANRPVGGGAWANRAGGGGAWANRAGGGGAWANRGGAWANRGSAWANRGGAWVNRY